MLYNIHYSSHPSFIFKTMGRPILYFPHIYYPCKKISHSNNIKVNTIYNKPTYLAER